MSAPTITVGTPPPNRSTRPVRAAMLATVAQAVTGSRGEWVRLHALPASTATRLKDDLVAKFGADISTRYARTRENPGKRDLYVRLCCNARPVDALWLDTWRRDWFAAERAA